MSLTTKKIIIGFLGLLFLASLVLVQWMEVVRKKEELGITRAKIHIPASSKDCVECHTQSSKGLVDHWMGSTHAEKEVGCVECHQADEKDADAFSHYGHQIATVVTPRDCGRCHQTESAEFQRSHHAEAGNILASLDNFLAEVVEGHRGPFNPHSPTPGMAVNEVNGRASVVLGCMQCHGSKVGLKTSDGKMVTADDLKPNAEGKPTNLDAIAKIVKDSNGRPVYHESTWPNTGIGRLNLDGSKGSCSACHSRHDFSPRRARQPENCGKCHLGPDHPQKEIYEESKHGVAYRDLKDEMKLDAKDWVLGETYTAAPTCATCHMSANTRNGRRVTHDPGERISWTNRPPISLVLDTDVNGKVVTEADPVKRKELIAKSAESKRMEMKNVCSHCHSSDYVQKFYVQYDELVILYNEKFAKPGKIVMDALYKEGFITPKPKDFDDEIEWSWYLLWHHEGRRARHGASMMAPDYTHWHGMFEVAERFYMHFVPDAKKLIEEAKSHGKGEAAARVEKILEDILSRPEHAWQKK